MKKLMIAMGAAAMMSLCAQAKPQDGVSLVTGTTFDSYSGTWDPTADDNGGSSGKVYWTGGGGDSAIAVKPDDATDQYLKVDETEELTRRIDVKTVGEDVVVDPQTVDSASGVYFSSKVQFTAADDAPEVTEDVDKIIVWAKAPADDADPGTTTNLMVTALDLVDGTNKVYDTGVAITADQWYTLDIVAAAQNADSPIAFTVSLDGTSVGTFNSMVLANITGATTISSASFKGTGAVDNIDWGTVAAAEMMPLIVEADNITTVSYTVDGGAATTYAADAEIPANAQTLVFTVTPASGYAVNSAYVVKAGEDEPVELAVVNNTLTIDVATYTTDDGVTVAFVATEVGEKTLIEASNVTLGSDSAEYTAGMQFPKVTVTVGGEPLTAGTDYTLTWDPGSITQAGTYTATVEGIGSYYGTVQKTFTVTAPQSDLPQVGGNDCATGADFVAAATSGTVNTLPSGWTVDGNEVKDGTGATFATFPAFYTVSLSGTTLTLSLNNNALATMTAVTVGETFGLSVSASDTKLYYGLSSSTTVGGEYTAPTSLMKGTGNALAIPAAKSGDQRFYKLYVTDVVEAGQAVLNVD